MTSPREIKPRSVDVGTSLETVRVSNGTSARIGAVAVAGLLVTVIWAAVSGQPAAPLTSSATAAPRQTALVAAVEPTPDARTPAPEPGNPGGPAPVARTSTHRYSIVARLGGRQFVTALDEDESGNLSGALAVPVELLATEGTLELARSWRTVSHDAWEPINSWPLKPADVSTGRGPEQLVLDKSVRPRRAIVNAPRPVVRGFRITVHALSSRDRGHLRIDIQLGPRGQLQGNDGIFGWPVVAQIVVPVR